MSQHPHRRRAASGPFYGLSFGTSLMIFGAALATGVILSVLGGTIGVAHLVLFVLAALILTLLTEPKALYLFVGLQPFLFGTSLVVAGTLMVLPAPNGFGRTQLVTAVYPLTQFFPTMMLTLLGSAAIAVLRLLLLNKAQRTQRAQMERTRIKRRQTNQVIRTATTKSRSQAQRSRTSGQITVSELVERNKNAKRRRPSSLDNPANRGARTYAPRSTRPQQPQEHPEQPGLSRTAETPAHSPMTGDSAKRRQATQATRPSPKPSRFSEDLYGD